MASSGRTNLAWGSLISPTNAPASPIYSDEFNTNGAFGGTYTAAARNGTVTWNRSADMAVASVTAAACDAALFQTIPGTPSSPMRIASAVKYLEPTGGGEVGAGLVFSDGASTTSNWCCLQWVNTTTFRFVTYTGAGSASAGTSVTTVSLGMSPLFIRLDWTSSNLFTGFVSLEGATWISIGTQAFTLTPTHFGLYVRSGNPCQAAWDYVRLT